MAQDGRTAYEQTYVSTKAAKLVAQHELESASRAYRHAVDQLGSLATDGRPALQADRLIALDEQAIQESGLSEDSREVKRARAVTKRALAFDAAIRSGKSAVEALGEAMGGGGLDGI
jgi:hypothetical protein